ncbi:MAG: hypothetical protein AAB343_03865 [Patescibacteria group bacterium]
MKRNALLIFIAIVTFSLMACWIYYIHEKATFSEKNAVKNYQLDKIIHVIGGIFIISVAGFLKRNLTPASAISSLIVVALVWEIGELVFDPEVSRSFYTEFIRWRSNAIFDVIASIIGGAVFYSLLRPRALRETVGAYSDPQKPTR